MKSKKIENIYEELISIYLNLKAEVFVSEIIENTDLDFTDFDIMNLGTFSRPYRRDAIDFKIESSANNPNKIKMELSRNGMYDILPEGLFHDQVGTNKGTLSFKNIRQKNKKQEKDARLFFFSFRE